MTITGAQQFEQLGARLAVAGAELRLEMQAALHAVAPKVIEQAKQNARTRLPKAGGLNVRVGADAFVVQDRASTIQAGIRIGTTATDARGSNYGRIRHPVFGNRNRWIEQIYEPGRGWFDDAMESSRPQIEAAVAAALAVVNRNVTKGA